MSYDKYREVLSQEEYFDGWEQEHLDNLRPQVQESIYNKYVVKCEVLQRDSFSCQNLDCTSPNSKLTMHHVKFQKNGGEDKVRNCLTLCKACHQGFHRAENPVVLCDGDHLPSHMQGQTYRLAAPDGGRDWKKFRSEMKDLRRRLKKQGFKAVVSWEDVWVLMQWLFGYDSDSEDDD